MSAVDYRGKIEAELREAVQHEPSWHYAMTRPIPIARIAHQPAPIYPLYTDCSGFVIGIFRRVGLPDPSGFDYSGYGNTGSLIASGTRIATAAQMKVGDCVIYADGSGDTHHVAMCLTPGANPMLVSHGQEAGPQMISLSDESAYHHRLGRHPVYVTFIDDKNPDLKPMWIIQTGRGVVIGRTRRPRLWLLTHKPFMGKWDQIRFIRR